MANPHAAFPMVDVQTETITAMQDGIKRPFLCGVCEQRIGNWERNFKERFFDRFLECPGEARQYREWLPLFSVSIVWRVLQHYSEQPESRDWPAELQNNVARGLRVWRRFLLGEARSPRPHDVHLFPVSADVGPADYVTRTLEMQLAGNRRTGEQYLFVKLGPILLVGVIVDPSPKLWRYTRIDAVRGVWGAQRAFATPATVRDWAERRARHVSEIKARWPLGPPGSWPRDRRPKRG